MKQSIFTVLFCLGVMSISAQSAKEKEIIKKVEALGKAVFVDKDSAALENLLCEKLTYGHSSGKLETKQVMIHNAVNSTMIYPGFVSDSIKVIVEGNTAIARLIIKSSKTIDKGVEGTLHLGILLVWVKEMKDWKLIARQAVKL